MSIHQSLRLLFVGSNATVLRLDLVSDIISIVVMLYLLLCYALSNIHNCLYCRATGNQIPGYTLSETVINPVDGALYRVYVPDSDIQPVLPPDDSLSDLNRVPTGENDGGEIDGGGQLDRVFGSSTTRTGSCSKSIKNIGAALPENCKQGE